MQHAPFPLPSGPPPGAVWLVGAGPGDPGLLTLRALGALRGADIVFYDALPGTAVLRYVPHGVELVNVGKRKGCAPTPQSAIGEALVVAARAGLRVVRLKGGDPSLFGRSGEETRALTDAGVPWDVVPGVTSASAAAAAAGIPLTLRGGASNVTFVTGHGSSGELPGNTDWDAVGRTGGTVVAYMAMSRLDEVALRLLTAGRGADTPVAVVSRATLPGQSVLRTTLGACTLAVRRAAVPTPALVIIGEVARTARNSAGGQVAHADDALAALP